MTENLQSRADGEDDLATLNCTGEGATPAQLLGRFVLRQILSPAKQVDVTLARYRLSSTDFEQLRSELPRLGTVYEDDGVAAVAVRPEQIGQQNRYTEG